MGKLKKQPRRPLSMTRTGNSKIVAAISILILVASVLCNPIQSVFADMATLNELKKGKKLAEEQAKQYLKNIRVRSGYGELNSTTTKESTKDKKADLEKAKKTSEEKAKQYLKTIGTTKKNRTAKIIYGQNNYTSTDESGRNAKADLEKAKKTSEEKAKEMLEKLFPKLAQK